MTIAPASVQIGTVIMSTGQYGFPSDVRYMVTANADGALYVLGPTGAYELATNVDTSGNFLGFTIDDPFAHTPKGPPNPKFASISTD